MKLNNSQLSTWVVAAMLSLAAPGTSSAQSSLTFAAWKSRCMAAPANRTLKGRMPEKQDLPLKEFKDVQAEAHRLLKHFQQSDLAEASNWVGQQPKEHEFLDISRSYYTRPPIPFQPFTQKVNLPPDAKVIFHGDFHGDIRSLISMLVWLNENDVLDGFKIKDAKTHLVFLGDYVDRGSYGIEVIFTLMRLKLDNPSQVILVRGNHEDFKMTTTYGFIREGQLKYGRAFSPLSIWRLYDFLPVVVYIGDGSNYIQCNHGGMEPGYDPRSLLSSQGELRYQFLGELKQATFAADHPKWLSTSEEATRRMADAKLADFTPRSPVEPATIGFMWNDFSLFTAEPTLAFNEDRLAFVHGQSSTSFLLRAASSESHKVRAVFRAHQHSGVPNPMMDRLIASKGVYQHWQSRDLPSRTRVGQATLADLIETSSDRSIPDGSTWTFNVAPDSMYGEGNDYAFDTFGILTTADSYSDWRLRIVNVSVDLN